MKSEAASPKNIDEYIAGFPPETQKLLTEVRQAIKEVAPESEETISYQMPAFRLNGILVYFAAFKNHIGFFPTNSGVEAFKDELSRYKGGKGSIQFPFSEPLPLGLIKDIVKFRVAENIYKTGLKKKSR
jgi:uncharacterized protein YdhG (YjbR/CyaY superfamily)